jgi:glutaredoxin
MFVLRYCGYCRRALQLIEAVRSENPELAPVEIEIIDEGEQRELARRYDYYYVPSFYLDRQKLHEGPVDRQQIKAILQKGL